MTRKLETLYLWPEGAPRAKGNAPEDRPRLTPFLPDAPGPLGAVVVCPGGGYQTRAEHEREPIARWLADLGLAAFVLDYRVKPYHHPVPLLDAQRAIRTVRARGAEWKIDPRRVAVLGFSAGGHLTVSTATLFEETFEPPRDEIDRLDARPDAIVDCYGVVSFVEFHHQGCMTNFLGADPAMALRESVSLDRRVTPRTPPAFIWHTVEDAAVPIQHPLLLAQALSRHGVPYELHIFPKGRHGLGLALEDPAVRAWTELCARWLKDVGIL
ncbi:MAG: alpha/beta hydrolase [Planctomycetota bacterium]|nr:alpha/beta hydrolase [Planctomycetota bacterium]